MTTDLFTTAAREEAKERLTWHDQQFGNLLDPMVHMAEWARTHLAAQEPTDAEQAVRELHHEREWRQLDGTFIGGTVYNACRLARGANFRRRESSLSRGLPREGPPIPT